MSKRVFLTLPDGVADDLERWAEAEGNKAASLAGFIVEQAVRQAKEQGKIPPKPTTPANFPYTSISQLVTTNWDKLLEYGRLSLDSLKALRDDGKPPSDLEIARLAIALQLDEAYIESLASKR